MLKIGIINAIIFYLLRNKPSLKDFSSSFSLQQAFSNFLNAVALEHFKYLTRADAPPLSLRTSSAQHALTSLRSRSQIAASASSAKHSFSCFRV